MISKTCPALALLVAVLFPAFNAENLEKQALDFVKDFFPGRDSIIHERIPGKKTADTEKNTAEYLPVMDIFTACSADTIMAYGFMHSLRSRSSVLTLLLITDKQGKILCLELLDTPDSYSRRLRSKAWKRQFTGKNEIKSGTINAVSGATISSRDVENAVRNILIYAEKSGFFR